MELRPLRLRVSPLVGRGSAALGNAMFDLHLNRDRRDFLRVGGLSAWGLGLPTFLRQQADAAGTKKRRAKSVILVYLGGGLSHHDSLDPKPQAAAEVRGKYHTISTKVPGLIVG